MAVLAWPAGLNPARISAHLRANSRVQTSPWTRSVQTQERPGARWEFTLEFDRLRRSEIRGLEVLIAQLRGSAGRVRVPHFARAAAAGSALGTPVVRNRSNLLKYAQELNQASAWQYGPGLSININAAAAPDGTITADTLVPNGVDLAYIFQPFAITAGLQYTISFYAHQAVASSCVMAAGGAFWTNTGNSTFNLATGVASGAGGESMQAVGDGWYRCACVRTAAINHAAAGRNLYPDLVGTPAAGRTVYVWGMQAEQAATPSAYVATTSTAIASQPSTGTTLYTGGWDASESGLLLPADIVTANDEMKRVCAQVDSDAWGNAAITIEPPLRASPNNGAAVAVASPTAYMMLIGDAEGAVEYARTHGSCVLSFLEAFS